MVKYFITIAILFCVHYVSLGQIFPFDPDDIVDDAADNGQYTVYIIVEGRGCDLFGKDLIANRNYFNDQFPAPTAKLFRGKTVVDIHAETRCLDKYPYIDGYLEYVRRPGDNFRSYAENFAFLDDYGKKDYIYVGQVPHLIRPILYKYIDRGSYDEPTFVAFPYCDENQQFYGRDGKYIANPPDCSPYWQYKVGNNWVMVTNKDNSYYRGWTLPSLLFLSRVASGGDNTVEVRYVVHIFKENTPRASESIKVDISDIKVNIHKPDYLVIQPCKNDNNTGKIIVDNDIYTVKEIGDTPDDLNGFNLDKITPNTTFNLAFFVKKDHEGNDLKEEYQNYYSDPSNNGFGVPITIQSPLSLNGGSEGIICNGTSDGKVTLTASGGDGVYTYSKDGSSYVSSNTFIGLNAGSYKFYLKDKQGCTDDLNVTINQYNELNYDGNPIVSSPIKCNGGTGSVTITGCSGGTGTITATINGKQATVIDGTATISGLSAGPCDLVLSSDNDCTKTFPNAIEIKQPDPISESINVELGICYGNASTVTTTVSGGTLPYSYSWNGGANTPFPGSSFTKEEHFGNKTKVIPIKITDSNGCIISTNVEGLDSRAKLELSIEGIDSYKRSDNGTTLELETCSANNVSFTLSPSGGVASYTFKRNDNLSSSQQENLAAGTYNYVLTDSKNCSVTKTVKVYTKPSLSVQSIVHPCGNSDGTITLAATGGSDGYKYALDGLAAQDGNVFSAKPGSHTIKLTDRLGCDVSVGATLNNPFKFSAVSKMNCDGNDASIIITVDPNYKGSAYTIKSVVHKETNATYSKLTGLKSGTYDVTLASDGCEYTLQNIKVYTKPVISAFVVTNPVCQGGKAVISSLAVTEGSGNLKYYYKTPSITNPNNFEINNYDEIELSENGTVTIGVIDNTGSCTVEASREVKIPKLEVDLSSEWKCISTSATLAARVNSSFSAYTVELYRNGTNVATQNGTTAGEKTFTFEVKDRGDYKVVVTASNGCKVESGIIKDVKPKSELKVKSVDVVDPICHDGLATVTINLEGGSSPLSLQNCSGTIDGNAVIFKAKVGENTFTVSDGYCIYNEKLTIANPERPKFTHVITHPLCSGDAAQITFGTLPAGATYSVDGGSSFGESRIVAIGNISETRTPVSLQIKDSKGCLSDVVEDEIVKPDLLKHNMKVTDVSCFEGNDGAIALGAVGGTMPYKYHLKGSGNTFAEIAELANKSAGTYTIKVTDAHGCETEATSYEIGQPDAFSFTAEPVSPTCRNGETGKLMLQFVGGNQGNHYYSLDNSDPTVELKNSTIANLASGSYSLTVKDSKGCKSSSSVTIENPKEWKWTVKTLNPTCANNGVVTIESIENGHAPYYFTGDTKLAVGGDVSGLGTGTTKLSVTDNEGCVQTHEVSLSANPLIVNSLETKNVVCYGKATGVYKIKVSGGRYLSEDKPYSTSMVLADGTSVLANNIEKAVANDGYIYTYNTLLAGTYTFTATDQSGCNKTTSVTIKQPNAPITFSITTKEAIDCHEKGLITVYDVKGFYGDKENLVYEVAGVSQIGNPELNVITGRHTVTVIDTKGCSASVKEILKPEQLSADLMSTPIDCNGNGNGKIEVVNLQGGIGSLYTCCKPSNEPQPQNDEYTSALIYGNLNPNKYTVYGRDENNRCVMSLGEITISDVEPLSLSYTSTDATCNSYSDAKVDIQISGGNGGYKLNIMDKPQTVSNDGKVHLESLKAGNYSYTLTDSKNCPCIDNPKEIAVAEPKPVSISLTSLADVRCYGNNDGQIQVRASGGSGLYNFALQKEGSSIGSAENATSNYSFANLAPGSYKIAVSDTKGCTEANSFVTATIAEPAKLTVAVANFSDLSCFGDASGKIEVKSSGGNVGNMSYALDGAEAQNSPSFSGLAAIEHKITVIDAKGCTAEVLKALEEPKLLEFDKVEINAPLCNGGEGNIVPAIKGGVAPYAMKLDVDRLYRDLSTTYLYKGNYTLYGKDAHGCEIERAIEMAEPELLTLSASVDSPLCTGDNGKVTLSAEGGTGAYIYTSTAQSLSANTFTVYEGAYSFAVKDENGCEATKNIEIEQPQFLSLPTVDITNPNCNGLNGVAELSATGGTLPYTYTLSYGSDKQWDLASIKESDSKAYFYLYGTQDLAPAVKDANGCISVGKPAKIVEPAAMTWIKKEITPLLCNNDNSGHISLLAEGGAAPYTYFVGSLSNTSGEFDNLDGGFVTVEAEDKNGCRLTQSLQIGEPEPLSVNATVIPQLCFDRCDGRITILPQGGTAPYAYKWSKSQYNGKNLIENLCGDDYSLTITDKNGCSYNETFSFPVPEQILVDVGFKDTVLCKGNSVIVSPKPAKWGFTWLRDGMLIANGSSLSIGNTGKYVLRATNAKGCSAEFDFSVVSSDEEIIPDFLVSSKVVAKDTVAFIDITSPMPESAEWIAPEAKIIEQDSRYLMLSYDNPGTYSIKLISHGKGCTTSIEKVIEVGKAEERFEIEKSLGYKQDIVETFKLYPNPNTGLFKVKIGLRKSADVLLMIYSVGSTSPLEEQRLSGSNTYEVEFNKSHLSQGFYLINIIVEGERHSLKMVKI